MSTTKAYAINRLREVMPPGSTVYTVLRHVSQSGMTRAISVVTVSNDDIRTWDYLVSDLLGWKLYPGKTGIKVTGCGMDMGFHLVYSLSYALYGDGYALNHDWI